MTEKKKSKESNEVKNAYYVTWYLATILTVKIRFCK